MHQCLVEPNDVRARDQRLGHVRPKRSANPTIGLALVFGRRAPRTNLVRPLEWRSIPRETRWMVDTCPTKLNRAEPGAGQKPNQDQASYVPSTSSLELIHLITLLTSRILLSLSSSPFLSSNMVSVSSNTTRIQSIYPGVAAVDNSRGTNSNRDVP